MLQPESKKGLAGTNKFTLVDFIKILEHKLTFLKVAPRRKFMILWDLIDEVFCIWIKSVAVFQGNIFGDAFFQAPGPEFIHW